MAIVGGLLRTPEAKDCTIAAVDVMDFPILLDKVT